ncbi:MAG: Crp/Fnr family transcriptional regulator [Clostridium sp.]
MKRCFINDGISKESIDKMIVCFKPDFKTYTTGETIMRYSDKIEKVGVMVSGKAQLYVIDYEGDYSILETYEEQDVFGELFYLPLENYEYIIEATKDTKVFFIDYKHIITPCENACIHHSQLINNLFIMAAQKSQAMSLHLSILNQHSIRKKLLTYLNYIKISTGKNPFTLPMTLSSLAEYLCVDRSAMMREIKILREEGLLTSDKREFYLKT